MSNKQQPIKKEQVVQPKKESKPKVPGIEQSLIGKRVRLTDNTWKASITGKLVKVEKYLYVIEMSTGNIIVNKHSVGTISGVKEEEKEA